MHVLGALATFERERLRERMICGLQCARAQGKKALSVSYSVVHRWRLAHRSTAAA